jgi:hypothetical protein
MKQAGNRTRPALFPVVIGFTPMRSPGPATRLGPKLGFLGDGKAPARQFLQLAFAQKLAE